jgi:hypothetical protein
MMVRKKTSGEVMYHVKRARLEVHLGEVEDLINCWITELVAPHPSLLESVYVPSLEKDVASNHMLRKHLRKRALWNYHTEWERKLKQIQQLKESKLPFDREWAEASVLQERMVALAQKAVKSSDFLYPCQFCRRLWQVD